MGIPTVPESLAHLSFMDWCVVIGTICTVGLLLYVVLDHHWPKDRAMAEKGRRSPLPFALAIVALLAFGADAIDRHFFRGQEPQIIQAYGMISNGGGFYAVVNPVPLAAYRNTYKMFLVTRISYTDVDRMTDTNIDKSKEYTITQEPAVAMAVIIPLHYKMNFSSTQSNLIDYVLCVLPSNVSLDSVNSLSDVDRLGGKIVASAGQGLGPLMIKPNQPSEQITPSAPK